MEVFSIASGSSGNCFYVGCNNVKFLIDGGISAKRIEEGLVSKGIRIEEINAILVTHEHSDHILGVGVIARRYKIPIYATRPTINTIIENNLIGKIDTTCFNEVEKNSSFRISDVSILPVPISHDAADPVAYIISHGNKKLSIITDLGCYDDSIIEKAKGCDILLVESNHDVRMLELGSYPYILKKRILSDIGHLSNEDSGRLTSRIVTDNTKHIMLCHLSKENNFDALALESVKLEIDLSENVYKAKDFSINVAPRKEVSDSIII